MKIELENVSKRFGATLALNQVSLRIDSGEIHAIVGENGAGKSTLGKIIAGLYQRDSGVIKLDGTRVDYSSPYEALQLGVTIVAQELSLVPGRSVIDNVFLGIEDSIGLFVSRKRMRGHFQALIKSSQIEIDPDIIVRNLRGGDQQKVEILRALARKCSTIIMDEPTARLSADEKSALKKFLVQLKKQGYTIIFISHFLADVLEVADRITIMRDGFIVRTSIPTEETHSTLIEGMTGVSYETAFPEKVFALENSKIVLQVDEISSSRFKSISIKIRAGEILGIAGLVGSGRTELIRAIYGVDEFTDGKMYYSGSVIKKFSPSRAISAGISFLPESRKEQGIIPQRSLSENVSISHLNLLVRFSLIIKSKQRNLVDKFLTICGVKANSPAELISNLSGGNQQKALFARALAGKPQLFIADEPTRGVDVGSKRAIYNLLAEQARKGMAVLVVSSELEEIVGISHRILIMKSGEVVCELDRDQISENAVIEAMFLEKQKI